MLSHIIASLGPRVMVPILVACTNAAADIPVTAVAVSGEQAPGLPPGVLYTRLDGAPRWAYLDAEGRVLYTFVAGYTTGWWRTGPGGEGPDLFVRILDPAPSAPGFLYSGMYSYMGDGGGLGLSASLRLGTVNEAAHAVYVGTPGNLRLAAMSGVPMDVLGGGTFESSGLGTGLMTNGSLTVFNGAAHLNASPTTTGGLWLASSDGTVQTLALQAGTLSSAMFLKGIDQGGRVGFILGNRLYTAAPGDVRPAAYSGGVADATYTGSGAWVFEDSAGTRVHALHPNGTLKFLAIAGTQAPGMPEGVTFNAFRSTNPSRSGENALFRATLNGPGIDPVEQMTFAAVNGQKRLLARAGLPAPGLGPDVYFLGFSSGAVNDAGQIVMAASLTGPGVTADNDNALWYDPGDGVLRVLLREGDPLDFDGQSLVVRSFRSGTAYWSHGGTGGDTFNNAGQFVCGLTFTDGRSGVFLFQIPEPSVGAAIMLGLAIASAGRRRGSDS